MENTTTASKATPLFNGSLAVCLEWLDFSLFIFISPYLSYMANRTPKEGLSSIALIFFFGYLFRPVGSIVFQVLEARIGRAQAALFGRVGVSASFLFMACLPAESNHSFWLTLFMARALTGFFIGSQYRESLNALLLSNLRGSGYITTTLSTALQGFGLLLASTLALGIFLLIPDRNLISWGWRGVYFFSFIICTFIVFKQSECPTDAIHISPLKNQPSTKQSRAFLLSFITACSSSMIFVTIPLATHSQTHISMTHQFQVLSPSFFLYMLCCPYWAYLTEKYGYKAILAGCYATLAIGLPLLFPLYQSTDILLRGAGMSLFFIVTGGVMTAFLSALRNNEHHLHKPTALNFATALGMGGAFLLTIVAQNQGVSPEWIVSSLAVLGLMSSSYQKKQSDKVKKRKNNNRKL